MELLGILEYKRTRHSRICKHQAALHLAFFRAWKPQESYYYLKLDSCLDSYVLSGLYLGEHDNKFAGMFVQTINETYETA